MNLQLPRIWQMVGMNFLLLMFPGFALGEGALIEGAIRERGTRKPLDGTSIFFIALPDKKPVYKATAQKGEFTLKGVPKGMYQIVVNLAGYDRFEEEVDWDPAVGGDFDFFIERSSYISFETVVIGQEKKRDDVTKVVTREEFLKAPGAAGDPVRAVQNLPGVARASFLNTNIMIQGSGPEATAYQIDGHEVPIIFHFGGLTSVLFPDSLDRVDLLTAGFGPEFGRATGGLVNLWSKEPATDRWHGLGYVDVFNAGALTEGPIGEKSSFLLGARQSYIGPVLRAVVSGMDGFDLTVAPAFTDVTSIFNWKVTPRDELRVTTVGSLDSLEFLFSEPLRSNPSVRGTFSSKTAFVRIIPQYTHKFNNRLKSKLSLGMGRDFVNFDNNENVLLIKTWNLTARGEVEWKASDWYTGYAGWDNLYSYTDVNFNLPQRFSQGGISNPMTSGANRSAQIQGAEGHAVGLYVRNEFTLFNDRLKLQPNFRLSYFGETGEVLPSPRLSTRFNFTDEWFVGWAGGLYYQAPEAAETSAEFGNPNLVAPRAVHSNFIAGFDFREGSSNGWRVQFGQFTKYLDRLVIRSSASSVVNGQTVPENYNNDQKGVAIGGELRVRYDIFPFKFDAIYTLQRSDRWDPVNDRYLFESDQTHLLGLIGSYQIGNWLFSTRVRYATGNPFTPVNGSIYDADNDVYFPVRGGLNSQRVSSFFQWDVRIDRKFVFDRWILSFYLEVLNVTNNRNAEGQVFSYDYTDSEAVSGLPIIPIFGLKGEF